MKTLIIPAPSLKSKHLEYLECAKNFDAAFRQKTKDALNERMIKIRQEIEDEVGLITRRYLKDIGTTYADVCAKNEFASWRIVNIGDINNGYWQVETIGVCIFWNLETRI